MNFIPETRRAD